MGTDNSSETSWRSREYKRKRPQSLGVCLDLCNSLQILRNKWLIGGHYEKIQYEQEAKYLQQQLNRERGQYKIYIKEGLDDFSKKVVDELF